MNNLSQALTGLAAFVAAALAPMDTEAITSDGVQFYCGADPCGWYGGEPKQPKPPTPLEKAMYITYDVEEGDTFLRISQKLTGDKKNYEHFMSFAGFTDPTTLRAGTEIRLPFHFKGVHKGEESYFRWGNDKYMPLTPNSGGSLTCDL